jgi:rod shape-determining protein MreD
MVIQLPVWIFYFWPDWIALGLVYWCLFHADRVGPLVGFVIGTLLEVLFVRKFGVQGLGLAILALIVNRTSQQLKVLSIWQQMLVIGFYIAAFKLITGWLYGIVSDFSITQEYWYSIIGDMVIWPFVAILLNELRRLAGVK